ncbi:MAG TPA: pyruvate carboxylase subunit B [Candidatus Scatosoma pullistercoris]|uniref:Pyruvate carboxylase subunit B n=1 Tax=Candidatus Scatosoma pullistercoris TaxID=2840934 RepID=A0A9D1SFJ1_9FIRM|nr:pyruvate carboxylase subunit B [Candidatus Scatosoma pullistercoris]
MEIKTQNKKIMITETILRDAHQSQAATRMRLDEMLPVLEQLDDIGYYSLEAWGGATFDSCLRFLNEDPWERLRVLKSHLKKTPIQMLLRGQNLLGYRHYADDLVEKFVEKSIENGVGVVRVFDALNDPRNLETSMKAIKKYGGVCEATICYTTGPVYTKEYFVKLGKQLEDMGADNICLKDMANLLLPFDTYELVKALKEELRPETKLHLHTHNTTGTGDMVYLMAILAGVDIVDTALSPLGNGTSQPATEPLVATLKGTGYDTGIQIEKLLPIVSHFKKVEKRLKDDGILTDKVKGIDVNTLIYQVPGGMLSNLINQLKKAGKEDKLMECLAEVPNVRKDCGYPPLVTPSSQIVGTQAVLNVIMGERYKMVTKETKDLFAGKYGKLPMPINEEVAKKVLGNIQRIDYRPADDMKPEYEETKKKLVEMGYYEKEEDVLSYAVFEQVAENFFKWREAQKKGVDRDLAKGEVYPV